MEKITFPEINIGVYVLERMKGFGDLPAMVCILAAIIPGKSFMNTPINRESRTRLQIVLPGSKLTLPDGTIFFF